MNVVYSFKARPNALRKKEARIMPLSWFNDDVFFKVLPISISTLALIVATSNFRRKSGISIRGDYRVCSNADCEDKYVSTVSLENLKDRATVIFAIYLRVGVNYYITIEDFENAPLILRPYELYNKTYGPIEFYGINSKKIVMNKLLDDPSIKKQLVLSTAAGKYSVPTHIPRWCPTSLFFKNYMTAEITPVRSIYKEKPLGGNIMYVVEIISENGKEEIIPIRAQDYEVRIFRKFALTKEALSSADAFRKFLQDRMDDGSLNCKSFTVHDTALWREDAHGFYSGGKFLAKKYSAMSYYCLGYVLTRFDQWQEKRRNSRVRIRRNS